MLISSNPDPANLLDLYLWMARYPNSIIRWSNVCGMGSKRKFYPYRKHFCKFGRAIMIVFLLGEIFMQRMTKEMILILSRIGNHIQHGGGTFTSYLTSFSSWWTQNHEKHKKIALMGWILLKWEKKVLLSIDHCSFSYTDGYWYWLKQPLP